MTTHRVAAVQAEPVWMNIDATVEKTEELIASAARGGAELVGFPETWLSGYPVFLWSHPVFEQAPFVSRYHENSTTIDGAPLTRVRKAARRHGITVVVGFSERDGGSLYMSQVAIGPEGQIMLHRRKLKPTHAERTLFGEGDGSDLLVVPSAVGRLGTLNCYEHLQPLSKYAMYAQNEQVHVAGWPCLGILGGVPMLGSEAVIAASRTYAYEGSAFVIMSTQIMSEAGAATFTTSSGADCPVFTGGGGYAGVFAPDTTLLTVPLEADREGLVFADIDLTAISLAKNFVDPAGHYARPDVTRLAFDPRPRRAVIHLDGRCEEHDSIVSEPFVDVDLPLPTSGESKITATEASSEPCTTR